MIQHRFKRSTIHNLRVTRSSPHGRSSREREGLILPQRLLQSSDIVPYEQAVVTKIGGDNWRNRLTTFVLPGADDEVEALGALAYLLNEGDLCCVITTTLIEQDALTSDGDDSSVVPQIDLRFFPDGSSVPNDWSNAKLMLELDRDSIPFDHLSESVVRRRSVWPRFVLRSLITGLQVTRIERQCLEMSAELPSALMEAAGLRRNEAIVVYNSSRGGISADSYVVPNEVDEDVVISGALSRLADLGDLIAEAAFCLATDEVVPVMIDGAPPEGETTSNHLT